MKCLEKRPRELKNEAKRGKRGEKEATREAQRRPKRAQGGSKVVRLTLMGIQGDYILGPVASQRIKNPGTGGIKALDWKDWKDWKDWM